MTLASDSDPLLQPEVLAKEGATLAFDSDPPLRPEGLAKEGTTLASDSDPPLRPGVHRTSAYSSSPTGAVGADWETTERGRPLGKDPKNQAEQVRQGAQVNRNTEDRTLHTYKTVLSGHARRVLSNLSDMSEHEQCYGRRHLSYSMVGADICHTRRGRWSLPHASGRQQYCGRQ